MKIIKNKELFIEINHFLTILPNIAMGTEDRNISNKISGFVK
jgi:hypothetical protein